MTKLEIQECFLQNQKSLSFYLLGVSGSGMSGIARILLDMGHLVFGSDSSPDKEIIENLKQRGLQFLDQKQDILPSLSLDCVVFSSALRKNHLIFKQIKKEKIPVFSRFQILSLLLSLKTSCCVIGSHGKTNTSALLAHILGNSGVRISHYIGGEASLPGKSARWDFDSDFFIAELDESNGHLVEISCNYALFLNANLEHIDYYQDQENLMKTYQKFLEKVDLGIVYCSEDNLAFELCKDRKNAVSYGFEEADYTVGKLIKKEGGIFFEVFYQNKCIAEMPLPLPGRHQILNALGVASFIHILGFSVSDFLPLASNFVTTRKRFEKKGEFLGVQIFNDYAHCPSEVMAVLDSAQSLSHQRLIFVFQPHRYTRLEKFIHQFASSFKGADKLFILPVYASGENPISGIDGKKLTQLACLQSIEAEYLPDFEKAHHRIGNFLKKGDLLMILGAGDVHQISTKILRDFSILEKLMSSDLSWECASLYEPLSLYTTLRIGGPAQFWISPKKFSDLELIFKRAKDLNLPLHIMGRGSNTLVRDGGIAGIVIVLKEGEFSEISIKGNLISVSAGVRLKKLVSFAKSKGISGLEWMEGIPGNVGGSVKMNAGAMGGEMFNQVEDVLVLNPEGKIDLLKASSIKTAYRSTKGLDGFAILRVTLRGKKSTEEKISSLLNSFQSHRKSTQPIGASSGCIFKNSPEFSAGKIIDELGLKGVSRGDAMISQEHGNFILNQGNALASDVLSLINFIQNQVLEKRGVSLFTEVKIVGTDNPSF